MYKYPQGAKKNITTAAVIGKDCCKLQKQFSKTYLKLGSKSSETLNALSWANSLLL